MRHTLALAALIVAPPAWAQSARGVVTDHGSPLANVVVALVDSTSREVGRALTSDRGEFRLTAPRAGTYRIRTLRIGFMPTMSEPVALTVGADVTREIAVSAVAFVLDTIRSVGRNECRVVASDSTSLVAAIWNQVRTALASTQLSLSNRLIYTTAVSYQRTLGARSQRVGAQSMDVRADFGRQPWRALDADSLRRFGYVVTARDSARIYYAPDLSVLLSDEFVEDHCLRIAKESDAHRLGVEFEPTPARRNMSDIRGIVWLDRHTNALLRMEHAYVGGHRGDEDRLAGGEMSFVRMDNGLWAISRWNIRMPMRQMRPVYSNSFSILRYEARVDSIKVTGGDLVLATTTGTRRDTIWTRPPLPLRGVVVDSASGSPVRGAVVSLAGTSQSGTTDADGRFVIHGVIPGRYAVNLTAAQDSVTFADAEGVMFADTSTDLTLRVPIARLVAERAKGVVAAVAVTASAATPVAPAADSVMGEFDRRRQSGIGHFLTRQDIEKRRAGTTASLLQALPSLRIASAQGGDFAFNATERCSSIDTQDSKTGAGRGWAGGWGGNCSKFYVPAREERTRGFPIACYTRVYVDVVLMNPGTPTPPFDLREISPGEIEAIEFYASAAEMPARFRTLNSSCGLLIIHTRKGR